MKASNSIIFNPFSITEKLILKNRLVMVPIYTSWDFYSREFIAHYVRRAKGGVGLSIVPIPTWGGFKDLKESKFVDASRRFIHYHHAYGCKVIPQIFSGEGTDVDKITASEIEAIPLQFADAATSLKKIGYDGIEIHGAHHTLFMHLLSPVLNHRTDSYGGSLQNRMRIQLQTIKEIRKAVGNDFPIFIRFSATDQIEGGAGLETTIPYAEQLVQMGVDCLDISNGGTPKSPPYSMSPNHRSPSALFSQYTSTFKSHLSIPIIVAGKIGEKSVAESILQDKKADLIGLGRPLLADPDLPEKWRGSKEDSVTKCRFTNIGCQDNSTAKGLPIQCLKNKNLGKEYIELALEL